MYNTGNVIMSLNCAPKMAKVVHFILLMFYHNFKIEQRLITIKNSCPHTSHIASSSTAAYDSQLLYWTVKTRGIFHGRSFYWIVPL